MTKCRPADGHEKEEENRICWWYRISQNRERNRRHTLEDSARHLASASISVSICSARARYFARKASSSLIRTTSANSSRILSICPMRVHDHAKFALLVARPFLSSFFGNGLGGGGVGILLNDIFFTSFERNKLLISTFIKSCFFIKKKQGHLFQRFSPALPRQLQPLLPLILPSRILCG